MAGRKCNRCKSTGGIIATCRNCGKVGCECCVKDGICNRCYPRPLYEGDGFNLGKGGPEFHLGQQPPGSAWGEHVVFIWTKPVPRAAPAPRTGGFIQAFEKIGKK